MKLFVAGIPGTGKTCFGNKLRDEFGFMHINFEHLSGYLQQRHREVGLLAFLEEMSQFSRCLVATWGFPIECLPEVQALATSEVRLVWFDGDRSKAREVWVNKNGEPDTDFKKQGSGN
jgi:hypothetical protein